MPLTTNDELKAAIANWINRSDLTTEIVDFITLAEAEIATDLKDTSLLTTVTDITTDAANKDLPSNYKGTIAVYLDTDPKTVLDYMPPDEFHSRYAASESGKPIAYTLMGNDIYFAPSPDSSYTCKLHHYAKPDIATDSTNTLLTNHPGLYLWGACKQYADFIGDDAELAKWEMKYQKALNGAMEEANLVGALAIQLGDAP